MSHFALMPNPKIQFFNNTGLPLNGGYLYTYKAGSPGELKATYTDFTGTTENTNPIILDSSGRANIWLSSGVYSMQLWTGDKTSGTSTLIWSVEGVSYGDSDMLQSVYDTNSDGIVDAADTVAWTGVSDTPTTIAGYGILDAMALVAPGATGNILTSNGTGWISSTPSSVTGMTNPMTTAGDMIYATTSGTPVRLAKGTDGQVLTLATGVPSWASATVTAHTLDSHSNVTITSNSDGEILRWNGSAWVNNTLAEASVTTLTTAQTITGAKTFDGGIIITDEVRETPTVANTSTAYTVDITSGTLFDLTLTGDCTFTFPTDQAGRQFTLILKQDGTGSRTVTWPTDVRWAGGTTPTITATIARSDVFSFLNDGTYWLGFVGGQNYTRA